MSSKSDLIVTGEATAILPARDSSQSPVVVIGTKAIRDTFDPDCLHQALNTRSAPGVTDVVLNPDAHSGYGAPVGCVMASPTHIYPGPVGFDIKCSMSLLQTTVPDSEIRDRNLRRALIKAIEARIPTGTGSRSVPKGRRITPEMGRLAAVHGGIGTVCDMLGIPPAWALRCEDAYHTGHRGTYEELEGRLEYLVSSGRFPKFSDKVDQLGSYGSGNHFGECEVVRVEQDRRAREVAEVFGLRDKHVAFLSHCGSRGFGYHLARIHFSKLQEQFHLWHIPFPGGDKELVYAPLGTPEANDYQDDMALGANFATVNHLLINALVLEAFQEVLPGTEGDLVYFISHNIARQEIVGSRQTWVHRKGATRAFPAGHPALMHTPFADTGHPILLPGDPQSGSAVMVAEPGAEKSLFSVNHGAGRVLARRAAIRTLNQKAIDASFEDHDILTNCRQYPLDEAPAAYKDFNEVLNSVELAGLARPVARLRARFVIKDAMKSPGGSA